MIPPAIAARVTKRGLDPAGPLIGDGGNEETTVLETGVASIAWPGLVTSAFGQPR